MATCPNLSGSALLFTSVEEAHRYYYDTLKEARRHSLRALDETQRFLLRNDLFYLGVHGCGRKDLDREFLLERCQVVQAEPDGFLDLWAREHYKSTIGSFLLLLQDILRDKEITIGIFSVTRPLAKDLLRVLKNEMENNRLLKRLFPEILWDNPKRESPKWSEDEGLIVKRNTNPREATVEAWGLVDSMPTGKHFRILNYDDVVTERHVGSPEMMKKTSDMLRLSYSLGRVGCIRRMWGTRYHLLDALGVVIKDKVAKPRIVPVTRDGKENGEPVFWTREQVAEKRRDQGPYIFGCQYLLNPTADAAMGFKPEWIRYYIPKSLHGMNIYMICDPAGEKKKGSDYTVIEVMGLAADRNVYTIKCVRARMNLTERTRTLIDMHRQFRPLKVGYEKYGKDSDIEHIKTVMEDENYRFAITPLGGSMAKNDRIRRLVPLFENGRWWLPQVDNFVDAEGRVHNATEEFVTDELLAFPVSTHDDMLDTKSRLLDPDFKAVFPAAASPLLGRPDTGITQASPGWR